MKGVIVVGAGLAGSEAALTVARLGGQVTLFDMKPGKRTPAHHSSCFAELVCSNSLKSNRPDTAQGLLKEELRSLGSALLVVADETSVDAGGALAVDRALFSTAVTQRIKSHPAIHVVEREIDSLESLLDEDHVVIVATGPLTSGKFYNSIQAFTGGDGLHFFDAAAPIIDVSSIDMNHAFFASRYDKGGPDYINCPLSQQEYITFREALVSAQRAPVQDFDALYFKDCQPIEVLAERGEDTMRFGPLRPVGLIDPATGKRPYACLQLRKEDSEGTMWSPVGFQTRLTFSEQGRVFGLVPALKQAIYHRYGVMHRNSFLNGPLVLKKGFRSQKNGGLFFAGQLSGLEGYVEAIASGLVAAIQAVGIAKGFREEWLDALVPSSRTMIGALTAWVCQASSASFQPMNANFGLLPISHPERKIRKPERSEIRIAHSRAAIEETVLAIEDLLVSESPNDCRFSYDAETGIR
ncbi:MAG TPA: methylenetetrahydrofolate--tRNA-(uracil(54)-C(5))-methyltransferase (FADH(2)-oxidizing) TrmFO [Clostridia bacterium]|nr:methylenetetrahydrofolate--tRNA-(uracil(54)-C(5))-methyltransferase (FADH(2)-oxidizing) TrmFO [Clostridia bacterium]